MTLSYTSFPTDIDKRPWHIYPRKGVVSVDGYRIYSLKSLKCIAFDIRVGFPHALFVAIDKA